jgi:ribosomal protein S27AE
VKKSDSGLWQIEHPCPQCGAPVILEETDRLFSCSYCRIRLYLISEDYFRYFLPPPKLTSKDIFFVPYWRFKGMAFFCKAHQVRYGIKDMSFLASSHTIFPHSLGLRPQVLTLRFVSPELEARFFSPEIPLRKVIESIDRQLQFQDESDITGPIFYRAFIGETASQIYSPLYVQGNAFHDAILGRPIAPIAEHLLDDLLPFQQAKNWQIKFLPTMCPLCGWDLYGERDSVVLLCKNCDSIWGVSQKGFEQIDFGVIPGNEETAYYLPFWKMEAAIDDLKLQSHADLLRIANVPNTIKGGGEEPDLHFWTPAFKVPPELFLRLTQQTTLSPLQGEIKKNFPKSPLYPISLPMSEAAESIKLLIAKIAVDKEIFPKLNEIDVRLNQIHLIYLPFLPTGNDLVQSQTQMSIPQNSLKLGKYL